MSEIDQYLATEEHLRILARRQAKLSKLLQKNKHEIDEDAREAVLHWLSCAVRVGRLQEDSLASAAMLFDIVCAKTAPQISELPALAHATASVILKIDGLLDEVDGKLDKLLTKNLPYLIAQLQHFTHVPMAMPELGELAAAEVRALKLVGWTTQWPTVGTWLNAYCLRLDERIGTEKTFLFQLHPWRGSKMLHWLKMLQSMLYAGGGCSDKFAQGLLCAGVVTMGLIPVSMVADDVTLQRWQLLTRFLAFDTKPCNCPKEQLEARLEHLEWVTGQNRSTLSAALRHCVAAFWFIAQSQHRLKYMLGRAAC